MLRGIPHHGIACLNAVVDANAMNDDVGHILYCNAGIVGNVNIGTSTIDCLVTIHDEFFFELNDHVALKYDP